MSQHAAGDAVTPEPPRREPPILRLAAWLLIAWGAVATVEMVTRLVLEHQLHPDLDVFQVWVGWWLWKLDPRGRRIGLIVLRIGIGLVLLAAGVLYLAPSLVQLSPLGGLLGPIAPLQTAVTLGIELAVNLWLYYVLQRQDVRALFEARERPAPSAEPA